VSRRLALVGDALPADAGAAALDALADALLPRLRARLAAEAHAGELVDVVATIPAPKRALQRACRTGAIVGATRVGRRWLAPRASVDAWLRAIGPRPVAKAGDEGDALQRMRARLARPRGRRAG